MECDLRVLFHVADPDDLWPDKFFRYARHMPAYEGAVRAAIVRAAQEQEPDLVRTPASARVGENTTDDPVHFNAMARSPVFEIGQLIKE